MGNEPSRFNFASYKLIYQLANSHQFCRGKIADVPNFYHEQLIHCIGYKRLPRHGFVWRRQITFGSNGAEEEWLSQNSTLSSWSTFTAAGTLISLETDWLLWLQQGSIILDPWPLTWNEKEGRRRKASENCRQVMSGSWKPECRALFLRKWRRIAENDQSTMMF